MKCHLNLNKGNDDFGVLSDRFETLHKNLVVNSDRPYLFSKQLEWIGCKYNDEPAMVSLIHISFMEQIIFVKRKKETHRLYDGKLPRQ